MSEHKIHAADKLTDAGKFIYDILKSSQNPSEDLSKFLLPWDRRNEYVDFPNGGAESTTHCCRTSLNGEYRVFIQETEDHYVRRPKTLTTVCAELNENCISSDKLNNLKEFTNCSLSDVKKIVDDILREDFILIEELLGK